MEGHTLIALLTVLDMYHLMEPHLMEPVTLLPMQPILMVLLVLVEDLAVVEDLALAGVEEWEEDGGKLGIEALRAVLEYLPGLLF